MTYALAHDMLNIGPLTGSTGTSLPMEPLQTPECEKRLAIQRNAVRTSAAPRHSIDQIFPDIATPRQSIYLVSPEINTERTASQQVFDAIQALYLSNRPLARQIAERITALHRDSIAEDDRILPESLGQFKDFFLEHPDLGLPKITLTPDGTLRARWIHGPGNFVAIEFTGAPLAKLVAEIPRANGLTARHFSSEPVQSILLIASAIGASFV